MKNLIFSLVVSATFLVGCDEEVGDCKNCTDPLVGKWTTNCFSDEENFQVKSFLRDGKGINISTKIYGDSQCNQLLKTNSEYWLTEFQFPGIKTGKFIFPVNLTLESVKKSYHTQELVDEANNGKYWGRHDWELNKEFDYTGKKKTKNQPDDKIRKNGQKLYTLFVEIKNAEGVVDKVSEGVNSEGYDGSTEEKRRRVESEYKFKML